jgi:hypothetical protein
MSFNLRNLDTVLYALKKLGKDTLFQLSIGDAKDLISRLLERGAY